MLEQPTEIPHLTEASGAPKATGPLALIATARWPASATRRLHRPSWPVACLGFPSRTPFARHTVWRGRPDAMLLQVPGRHSGAGWSPCDELSKSAGGTVVHSYSVTSIQSSPPELFSFAVWHT